MVWSTTMVAAFQIGAASGVRVNVTVTPVLKLSYGFLDLSK